MTIVLLLIGLVLCVGTGYYGISLLTNVKRATLEFGVVVTFCLLAAMFVGMKCLVTGLRRLHSRIIVNAEFIEVRGTKYAWHSMKDIRDNLADYSTGAGAMRFLRFFYWCSVHEGMIIELGSGPETSCEVLIDAGIEDFEELRAILLNVSRELKELELKRANKIKNDE